MSGEVFARYARLYPVMVAYARHHGHEDPQAFAQEVFARTLKGRYADRGWKPETWLNTIARNLMTDYYRKRTHHALPHALQQTCTHDSYPCESAHIREAVAALPERWRTIIYLRYYADYSLTQTSAVLGIDEGAVKALQHRAIGGLRRRLEAA